MERRTWPSIMHLFLDEGQNWKRMSKIPISDLIPVHLTTTKISTSNLLVRFGRFFQLPSHCLICHRQNTSKRSCRGEAYNDSSKNCNGRCLSAFAACFILKDNCIVIMLPQKNNLFLRVTQPCWRLRMPVCFPQLAGAGNVKVSWQYCWWLAFGKLKFIFLKLHTLFFRTINEIKMLIRL